MRIHRPVLLQETVELLNCAAGGFYVDCTLGMGGHSEKILEASSPDGRLVAIDRDPQAIEYARKRLAGYGDRVKLIDGDYRMLNTFLTLQDVAPPNGVLADLGPSLLQLTQPERGFSFMQDGPLDMRMDPTSGETAAEILNTASAAELKELIRKFGEEKAASRIARKISDSRRKAPLRTTGELRKLIEEVLPVRRDQKIHPATKTFQALRIAVNRELEGLDTFIFDAFDSLAPEGRLVIIAFHSLEDRIIKQTFRFLSATCRCPKALMVCLCGGKPLSRLITRKAIRPSEREQNENPASRSARLRAIEKLAGPVPRNLWKTWQKEHE
jgi:16S rRNA (cytosine1402-N4)-methyltransferase